MSVQFGRWNLDGKPVDMGYLEKVGATLAQYGPDGGSSYGEKHISILYYAFHTTKEAHYETQPHISASGAVITWDGRLDNRTELISELRDALNVTSPDVAIVATAYEKWGADCLSKLIGDWALTIYNPKNNDLLLAKDFVGTRHLYYVLDNNQITWSTVLDPLILGAGKSFTICKEYAAGWLTYFPATHLTPYIGIRAVPPSSFVLFRLGNHSVRQYWDFDPSKIVRYRTDDEYEEHFRTAFAQAIRCRLRSDTPILAELSGGRDSSSIVCVADALIANAAAETPRLGTVSYYDDSEPNNRDERPCFTRVEEKRGQTGLHIKIGPERKAHTEPTCLSDSHCSPVPVSSRQLPEFGKWLASQGHRVVLSGIGGDEVMGGVPTPTPELQDLIISARLGALAHQLKAWALQKRKPWFHLFLEAARGFCPPALVGVPEYMRPPRWLQSKFVKCHWAALTGYPSRVKLLGSGASLQEDMSTLNFVRRQLGCKSTTGDPMYETRYPFLDRNLVEFMFAIPREQSVRPTQRRSLMRRALVGLVPDEVLNRKGKGLGMRAPLVQIRNDWENLVFMTQHMLSSSLGIVDSDRFLAVLRKLREGREAPTVSILRMTLFESWLRSVRELGIVDTDTSTQAQLHCRRSCYR